MVAGLAAWSDCGVSPLRNKDRGFSRARCHSAVALYRALRATRAVLHPERSSEGVGREESGEKKIREPDEIGPRDDRITRLRRLKRDSQLTREALLRVFVRARRRSSRSAPQLYTDIMRYCPIKLNASGIFELNLTHTDNH